MSLFVLDSDILSLHERDDLIVSARIRSVQPPDLLAITVITVEEQLSGWYALIRRARAPDELARAYQRLADCIPLLGRLMILSFTEPAIARYDALKAMKLNIRKMDLRIASITLANGGTLVTRNVRDFQRVPHLSIEDWTV